MKGTFSRLHETKTIFWDNHSDVMLMRVRNCHKDHVMTKRNLVSTVGLWPSVKGRELHHMPHE